MPAAGCGSKGILRRIFYRCGQAASSLARGEEVKLRWRIAVLISVAIAISYLDRQTLPVAIQAIGKDIPLSNGQFSSLQSAFLVAYALMYAGGGKLVDVLGTRRGFAAIMVFWSLALFFAIGLSSRLNAVAVTTLAFGAISVGFALFLILELVQPYTGIIKVTPGALREAIEYMGK